MPWSNLHITPALGLEVAAQVMVNDYDPQGALWHKLWYPQPGAAFFPDRYYTIRLAAAPSRRSSCRPIAIMSVSTALSSAPSAPRTRSAKR